MVFGCGWVWVNVFCVVDDVSWVPVAVGVVSSGVLIPVVVGLC